MNFEKLNYRLEKFSYTDIDSPEEIYHPLKLRINEKLIYQTLLSDILNNPAISELKYDDIHHEVYFKINKFAYTVLFLKNEDYSTLVSVTVFCKKRGKSRKALFEIMTKLNDLFATYMA